MNEATQIALIGVGGAILGGLLTALVQPIWTNIVSKRSKIAVEIVHSSFRLPNFLTKIIHDYVLSPKSAARPELDILEQLHRIEASYGMSAVRITNQSKKLVEGLALHLEDNRTFFSEVSVGGERRDTKFSRACDIGDLRPGAECDVVLWTSLQNTTSFFGSHQKTIVVSAKEYDAISIEFPAPDYISKTYFLLSRKMFWRFFWAFLILLNVTLMSLHFIVRK